MRWLNTIVIVALVAAMLTFALQNLQSVTVAFLGFSVSAPMAVLAFVI